MILQQAGASGAETPNLKCPEPRTATFARQTRRADALRADTAEIPAIWISGVILIVVIYPIELSRELIATSRVNNKLRVIIYGHMYMMRMIFRH